VNFFFLGYGAETSVNCTQEYLIQSKPPPRSGQLLTITMGGSGFLMGSALLCRRSGHARVFIFPSPLAIVRQMLLRRQYVRSQPVPDLCCLGITARLPSARRCCRGCGWIRLTHHDRIPVMMLLERQLYGVPKLCDCAHGTSHHCWQPD